MVCKTKNDQIGKYKNCTSFVIGKRDYGVKKQIYLQICQDKDHGNY